MESHREAPTSEKIENWLNNARRQRVLVFTERDRGAAKAGGVVSAARTGPWKWERTAPNKGGHRRTRVCGDAASQSELHLSSPVIQTLSMLFADTWNSPQNASSGRTSSCVNVGAYSCTFFTRRSINDVCFVTRGPSRDHTGKDAL